MVTQYQCIFHLECQIMYIIVMGSQPIRLLVLPLKNKSTYLIAFFGENPQHVAYSDIQHSLRPHHSQGRSMERWSQNTLMMVTARVF